MIGKERAYTLMEELLWLIEDCVQLAAAPKSYGTDMQFHRLDIHLIETIGAFEGINVTELAAKHGITKSAVSQAVRKLEKRGLVRRYQRPDNRKEILFSLTETGKTAFHAHREYHRAIEGQVIEEMAGFTMEEAAAVRKLIDLLTRRAARVRALEEEHQRR